MTTLSSRWFSLGAAFALLTAASVHADPFVVSVSGTEKFQGQNKKANNVISSESLSLKAIAAIFQVTAKDYALVFETNTYTLSLIPIHSGAGLPTYVISTSGGNLTSIASATPHEYLDVETLSPGGDAAGTDFDGITGVQSFTVALDSNADPKGVSGLLSGVATAATNDGFFNLKITGTKKFVQVTP